MAQSPSASPPTSINRVLRSVFTESRSGVVVFFLAALAAYWPVLNGGFIWDDAGHVTRLGLRSLSGLGRIWFEIGATQQYYPVLHSAFWLEHLAFGDNPTGYHVVNVLLHATAACLFATVLRRLSVAGAWLAAGLFLLHPICVESVAWITEQKNTLSTIWYLLSALAYLRFDQSRRRAHYAMALILFLLALGSKTVTASLPAALLVVFWWKRGRLDLRRDIVPLIPWFLFALGAGMLTSWVEREFIGARDEDFAFDLIQRVLLTSRIIWFYLGKLVYPAELIFIYRRWDIDAGVAWQYCFPAALLAAIVVGWSLRRHRGVIAATLFFVGTLFPALGFVNIYPFVFSFVADHFQYLASLGVFALGGVGLAWMLNRWPTGLSTAVVLGVALLLGTLTWRQSATYRNEVVLYESTLAKNPNAAMVHNNLGNLLVSAGRSAEAIPHFEAAVRLAPGFVRYEYSFAFALMSLSKPAEAIPHFERALQLEPAHASAHYGRGMALRSLGRNQEAEKELKTAIALQPDLPDAQLNLGLLVGQRGDIPQAIEHFAAAVRLNPKSAEAEFRWAVLLVLSNRLSEAFPHFENAVTLAPERANMRNSYGRALIFAQRFDEGIAQFQAAIQADTNNADAHFNLAEALRQTGRKEEADLHSDTAARLGRKPRESSGAASTRQ